MHRERILEHPRPEGRSEHEFPPGSGPASCSTSCRIIPPPRSPGPEPRAERRLRQRLPRLNSSVRFCEDFDEHVSHALVCLLQDAQLLALAMGEPRPAESPHTWPDRDLQASARSTDVALSARPARGGFLVIALSLALASE